MHIFDIFSRKTRHVELFSLVADGARGIPDGAEINCKIKFHCKVLSCIKGDFLGYEPMSEVFESKHSQSSKFIDKCRRGNGRSLHHTYK